MESARERLSALTSQIKRTSRDGKDAVLSKRDDDVVITVALRTPLTKAKKGPLKDTVLEDLLISILSAVKDKSNVDPQIVEDVCVGNVLHAKASYAARTAVLAAGFPPSTATCVASRWCSSGLLAVQQIANQIVSGSIDCGIAVGAESMSTNPDGGSHELSQQASKSVLARDCTMPMGWTSENVAKEFNITRDAMDRFAASSFQKAEVAREAGWTKDEIVPVKTTWKNAKTGESEIITADHDDGIRYGTTAESLGKIRAAFPQWEPSYTTGGNASQITDGAAALLLMRRSLAQRLGQPIIGKFAGATVVALEPRIMGIGPTLAIPKLLGKLQLSLGDIDIFEINEAFASMGVYCLEKLGLDPIKLNPRGGAIALGHPLGCTGTRQIVTALSELKRTGKSIAVTSMCVGTGMGMAGVIVAEG